MTDHRFRVRAATADHRLADRSKLANLQNAIRSLRAFQKIALFVQKVTDWPATSDVDTGSAGMTDGNRTAAEDEREPLVKATRYRQTVDRQIATGIDKRVPQLARAILKFQAVKMTTKTFCRPVKTNPVIL